MGDVGWEGGAVRQSLVVANAIVKPEGTGGGHIKRLMGHGRGGGRQTLVAAIAIGGANLY